MITGFAGLVCSHNKIYPQRWVLTVTIDTTYYWPFPSQGTRWTIIGAPRIVQMQVELTF